MPADSQAFLNDYKGQELDGKRIATRAERSRADIRHTAIVEQVRDGSSIRVRLLLEDGSHQFVNLVSVTLEESEGQI